MNDILQSLIPLVGLTNDDFGVLNEVAPKLKEWIPEIVEIFYNTLYEHESTAKVFENGERPAREHTLKHWLEELFTGRVNKTAFWEHQWFISFIHIKQL